MARRPTADAANPALSAEPEPVDVADPATGQATDAALTPPAATSQFLLASLLHERREQVLDAWVQAQARKLERRSGRRPDADVRAECTALLDALQSAVASDSIDVKSPEYAEVTRLVDFMSKDRARQGYSPTETAVAVFSLKDSLLGVLEEVCGDRPELLVGEIKRMNALIDDLGLQTFEAYVAGREEVIVSQQQSMLALSTPVVKLWDGIVALPLIGTLDSERTQTVMENLLQAIVETESQVAIIDITGVVTVDTAVAQNLLKTVAATRLMGADCIISGVRPQIAQTMVYLGVELGDVVTKATLADAFRVALRLVGANLAAGNRA
jgi:rsbT co-antagonist protein RsbR